MTDRQRQSSFEPSVDGPQMRLKIPRPPQAADPEIVLRQKTMLGAIKLCISLAGFECDKEVGSDLEIDPGHWSRIMRGEAHFPIDKLADLMRLCGNEAPLIWLVHARGYDPASLRRLESEIETENRLLRQELEAERAERRAVVQFLKETRVA